MLPPIAYGRIHSTNNMGESCSVDKRYTNEELKKVRRIAIRRKVWFALSDMERALVNLSIRVIKGEVRSKMLEQQISMIVDKIGEASRKRFLIIFRSVVGWGVNKIIARATTLGDAISLAFAWGCGYALRWARDLSFIRFL